MKSVKNTVALLLLFTLTICLHVSAQSEENHPEWLKILEANDIIDSIFVLPQSKLAKSENVRSYQIYYHQPLCHDDPTGETFPLRCALVVYDSEDPSKAVNEFYISGYSIDYWNVPDSALVLNSLSEIAQRYCGNLIMPEHRYFSDSSPVRCWERLDYCNANEASQDFHALINALKTAFKGKWAMTGVSKGGITTTMQHAFFPDDADVYVPNSAPFCRGLNDTRMHKYIENNGWTEKTRERMDSLTRSLLEDSLAAAYHKDSVKIPYFRDSLKIDVDQAKMDSMAWKAYYKCAMDFNIEAHADFSPDSIDAILDKNEQMRQTILATYKDFAKYYPTLPAQSVLNYCYVNHENIDATEAWKDFMPKNNKDSKKSVAAKTIGITKKQWEFGVSMPYQYQAIRELGRYGFDIRNLYEEGTEKYKQFAEPMQNIYDAIVPETFIDFPFFMSLKYDNHALFDMVEEKTKNAQKPIYFVYGEDDSWTGAAMEDEYINGDNVRKYIFPGQKHGVAYFTDKSENGKEMMELLDSILYYNTDNINEVAEHSAKAVSYNMLGQRVSNTSAYKGLYIISGKKYYKK